MGQPQEDRSDETMRMRVGHDELVINNKYETMSIANDALIAVFFLVGSVLFYFESLHMAATTLFLLGSIDFALRPVIRIARRTHLQRWNVDDPNATSDY